MNPVLMEIYSTVLPAAPYVIAAYAGILLVLAVYVFYITSKLHKTEKKLVALEEHVAALGHSTHEEQLSKRDIFKEN